MTDHSRQYRPDIDGLRALAVSAVIFFHVGTRFCPNGFLGVDVFFVISGYLITSLILKEMEAGGFSLLSFYERRMRRILPALFAALFACSLISATVLLPPEMAAFGKTLLAASLSVSNFYFSYIGAPRGYFDPGVDTRPLLHTWSLAVEEQFYLIFPITFFLLLRWTRVTVKFWLLLLGASSFALSLWMTRHNSVAAFYWSLPRAWELISGALLGLDAAPPLRRRLSRELVALWGIGMILGSICSPTQALPVLGSIALLPCAGTWLILYAGQGGGSTVRRLLSIRPAVFVGVRSYSLYLWHWPLIVFSRHLPFRLTKTPEAVTVLVGTVLVSLLSFKFIEQPFRGRGSILKRRQIFAFGCIGAATGAALGIALIRSDGLPQRYNASTRRLIDSNFRRIQEFDTSCRNWRRTLRSAQDMNICSLGQRHRRSVLFIGDSHVEQLYPAIKQLYVAGQLEDHGVLTAFSPGCIPDQHLNSSSLAGYSCDSLAKYSFQRAQKDDVDVVFLGFSSWWTSKDRWFCATDDGGCKPLSGPDLRRQFLDDLTNEIRLLRSDGKSVIVSLPFPIYEDSIPYLEINNAIFGPYGLAKAPIEIDPPSFRGEIEQAALRTGAKIFDPRQTLCPHDHCLIEIGGVSIYKDGGHLASSQVLILTNSLGSALKSAMNERRTAYPMQ